MIAPALFRVPDRSPHYSKLVRVIVSSTVVGADASLLCFISFFFLSPTPIFVHGKPKLSKRARPDVAVGMY